ncbi:MAG: hypothetical protein LBG58_05795 [Planctomycetaceae bacterium]|nr:hypothetical protein [Planctomycetaceae bacterium]
MMRDSQLPESVKAFSMNANLAKARRNLLIQKSKHGLFYYDNDGNTITHFSISFRYWN